MLIGLTFDLKSEYLVQGFSEDDIAEFDSEETITGIETALHELGFETERIGNIRNLAVALASGKRWDMVFNICEGLYGLGREAQVPALLDAFDIPYTFSDPLTLALTLHKGLTKRVIRDAGIPTADFQIIDHIEDIGRYYLDFPVFLKPVAEGSGKGIGRHSIAHDFDAYDRECRRLLTTYRQAVLVESYLPGREFTAGIAGTGQNAYVIGIMEVKISNEAEEQAYSRFIKENYQGRVDYALISGDDYEACSKVALDAWTLLGCRDAGRVDLKMDVHGIPNFIEVNPLAGLNYLHSDLPIIMYKQNKSYRDLISMIMASAMQRIKLTE